MSKLEGLRGREDIQDFGIMFEAVMEHFEPGNPDCFESDEARRDGRWAGQVLRYRGLAKDETVELVHDTTNEARHLAAWLSVVQPADFDERPLTVANGGL